MQERVFLGPQVESQRVRGAESKRSSQGSGEVRGGGGDIILWFATGRLEPNLPLFLPILLSGYARKFYLFCPKICQHLPILPEIMPVYFNLF